MKELLDFLKLVDEFLPSEMKPIFYELYYDCSGQINDYNKNVITINKVKLEFHSPEELDKVILQTTNYIKNELQNHNK